MNREDLLVDQFTNIHKAFHHAATQKIAHAKQHNHLIGLLLIDLDNFKSINNHLGHLMGDKLLSETHSRLAACLSPDDFISRIDGDEFVVVLGNVTSTKTVETAVQKLMHCFTEHYNLDGVIARVNASMGIVYYPEAGIDAQALLQSAAMCMSHAKSLGGNNYQYYTETIRNKYKKQSYLENELKFALEKKELFLTYQPIFDLATKKMVGMEALLRWRHPTIGLISPDTFIRLAENNGLISSIGEWALQTVCDQAKKWHNAGYRQFKISFNISSNQLLQKSFPRFMMHMFKNTRMPAQLLELELTETAFLTKASYFESILKKISKTGIGITIDDFGTGHSSLVRLKNLPIRALKIDKSFVFNITPDSFDAIIVNSLISLGEKLKMNVVAEGIETEADLRFLIANGCPQGQGYYLCKPLNAKQMTVYLKKHKNPKKPE